jgi:hypothetical protein
MPNIHRKHLRHGAVDRHRHSSLSAFLASEAADKAAPERVIRDCFRNIHPTGKTAAQIDAAADLAAAGAVVNVVTLTALQKAAISPTNLTFGEYSPQAETRSLKIGATTGAITVTFDDSDNSVVRASGSFVDDGFVVGSRVAITGAVDAGNNGTGKVVATVAALTITFAAGDITTDQVGDAGVTLTSLDSIKDVDGVTFANFGLAAGTVYLSGTVANDGGYAVETVVGAGLVLTDPILVVATDTSVIVSAGSPTVSYGVVADCLAATDEFTFDRSSRTIVSTDDIDFDTIGFVVGGLIEVQSTLRNNGRYKITAVTTDTITVARATTGSITVTFALGERGSITRSSGSFLTDGFQHGDKVQIAGAADGTNNAEFEVIGVTALVLYVKDLPASEVGDAGVTIATAELTDEVSERCKVVQYNTLNGFPTTNIVAGCILVGTTPAGQAFEATVASIPSSGIAIVTGAEFEGETDALGGEAVFIANVILRAAGDFEDDFFEAAEGISIAAAGAGVDGNYILRSTANTRAYVTTPFTAQIVRDVNATLKGRSRLTRGAGSWATDGFALGKLLYLQDTAASGANDGYWRIGKVVSTTVLEVNGATAAEVATASVDAFLINEQAR